MVLREKNFKFIRVQLTFRIYLKGDNKPASAEVKEDIQAIIQDSDFIYRINIYDDKKLFYYGDVEPEYSYEKIQISPDYLYVNNYGYGESNDTWHVDIDSKGYKIMAAGILLLGIVIYWTLFSIWAIINAYHRKRLNIGWIIAFALFNVIGY
jgi:hypothetical protein